MSGFGSSDIVQDQNGHALANVKLNVYGALTDAKTQTNLLATVTTNSLGQWPVTINGYDMVWVRDPAGNIWSAPSDTVAGDHASRLAALEGANNSYELQSHASSTYQPISTFDSTQAGNINNSGSASRGALDALYGVKYVAKTSSYTLATTDRVVAFNGTGLTATLPDPTIAPINRTFTVKNLNSSALTVVSAGTSKTIDGAASQALSQWGSSTYETDGTQWLSVGGGASSGSAWTFAPESYGAKGDGIIVGDVAVTASSAVITSASGKFTSGDVGKKIMVNGAIGSANIPLLTTIASFQSATQVTLSATASVTATGLAAIWGTDDTAAIQSAIDAASSYAVAHDYYGEVVFGPNYYIVAGAPVQTTSPHTYNTQLKVPYPPSNTDRKLVISFRGSGKNSHFQFWQSTVPNLAGSCLVSMGTAPSTLDATYGVQSVLGGPSGGFTGTFANTKVVLQDVCVVCPAYTNLTAIDLSWVGGCFLDGSAHIFAPAAQGTGVLLANLPADAVFQSRLGTGLRLPVIGNNADVWIPQFVSEGYTFGLYAAEHVRIGNLKTIYNHIALRIDTTLGMTSQAHGVSILGWTAEAYNGGISVPGGGICPVNITINTEASGSAYDVSDAGNTLRGTINWSDSVDSRLPVVSGASKVRIVNDSLGRGTWASPPAVPASNTAQTNTSYRDAVVVVAGGTVSAIAVDGVTMGITSGPVMVPSGSTITLTYTAAPTWTWLLR